MSDDAPPPPPGFEDPRNQGFTGSLGPIFRCAGENGIRSGFRVGERHCNPSGICHGGWLSTFADVSLVRQAAIDGGRWVTMTLTVDFLAPVRRGQWVESRCETVRRGGRTCHVQGSAHADGVPVLRMNAIFSRARESSG